MARDFTKIATCCYCGSRTILQLKDLPGHHELACASCSAPLHYMKPMKVELPSKEPVKRRRNRPQPDWKPKYKRKKKKKQKSLFTKVFKEVFEEITDIFD